MENFNKKNTVRSLEDTLADTVQKKINQRESFSEVERVFQAYENFCSRFGCISEKDYEVRKDYENYLYKNE